MQLTVEGTEFVLTAGDHRTLRSTDLVGVTSMIATGEESEIAVTIESVEEDHPLSVGGDVFLHRFVVKDASGYTTEFCTPDPRGRNLGFPIPNGKGGFELTCTSGAVGKCIRRGYRFWEKNPPVPRCMPCTELASA